MSDELPLGRHPASAPFGLQPQADMDFLEKIYHAGVIDDATAGTLLSHALEPAYQAAMLDASLQAKILGKAKAKVSAAAKIEDNLRSTLETYLAGVTGSAFHLDDMATAGVNAALQGPTTTIAGGNITGDFQTLQPPDTKGGPVGGGSGPVIPGTDCVDVGGPYVEGLHLDEEFAPYHWTNRAGNQSPATFMQPTLSDCTIPYPDCTYLVAYRRIQTICQPMPAPWKLWTAPFIVTGPQWYYYAWLKGHLRLPPQTTWMDGWQVPQVFAVFQPKVGECYITEAFGESEDLKDQGDWVPDANHASLSILQSQYQGCKYVPCKGCDPTTTTTTSTSTSTSTSTPTSTACDPIKICDPVPRHLWQDFAYGTVQEGKDDSDEYMQWLGSDVAIAFRENSMEACAYKVGSYLAVNVFGLPEVMP